MPNYLPHPFHQRCTGVQHYGVNLFDNYVNQSTLIHAIHEYTRSMDAVICNVHQMWHTTSLLQGAVCQWQFRSFISQCNVFWSFLLNIGDCWRCEVAGWTTNHPCTVVSCNWITYTVNPMVVVSGFSVPVGTHISVVPPTKSRLQYYLDIHNHPCFPGASMKQSKILGTHTKNIQLLQVAILTPHSRNHYIIVDNTAIVSYLLVTFSA